MGVSQAAIAFHRPQADFNPEQVIAQLFNKRVEVLPQRPPRFDAEAADEVVVEQYGDTWVISSAALAIPLLEQPHAITRDLHRSLGSPAMIVPFCQYESGGTYGYALIENGVLTRSRLQNLDNPAQQFGPLKPFEALWASAEFYLEEDDCPDDERQKIYYLGDRELEVPEHGLASRLGYEALMEYVGICPWDNSLEPRVWYLRLHDQRVARKAWWKVS